MHRDSMNSCKLNIDTGGYIQKYIGQYMHIPLSSQQRGHRSDDIPVVMITLTDQIPISDTILQLKESELLGEMVDSKTGAGNIN